MTVSTLINMPSPPNTHTHVPQECVHVGKSSTFVPTNKSPNPAATSEMFGWFRGLGGRTSYWENWEDI